MQNGACAKLEDGGFGKCAENVSFTWAPMSITAMINYNPKKYCLDGEVVEIETIEGSTSIRWKCKGDQGISSQCSAPCVSSADNVNATSIVSKGACLPDVHWSCGTGTCQSAQPDALWSNEYWIYQCSCPNYLYPPASIGEFACNKLSGCNRTLKKYYFSQNCSAYAVKDSCDKDSACQWKPEGLKGCVNNKEEIVSDSWCNMIGDSPSCNESVLGRTWLQGLMVGPGELYYAYNGSWKNAKIDFYTSCPEKGNINKKVDPKAYLSEKSCLGDLPSHMAEVLEAGFRGPFYIHLPLNENIPLRRKLCSFSVRRFMNTPADPGWNRWEVFNVDCSRDSYGNSGVKIEDKAMDTSSITQETLSELLIKKKKRCPYETYHYSSHGNFKGATNRNYEILSVRSGCLLGGSTI